MRNSEVWPYRVRLKHHRHATLGRFDIIHLLATDLQRAGMTIGSHGWTHPHLTTAGPRELQQEIVESRQTLERRLGTAITLFAYPFGEHPPAAEEAVRRTGYVAARGFPGGSTNDATTRWALRAVPVPDSLAGFRSIVGR